MDFTTLPLNDPRINFAESETIFWFWNELLDNVLAKQELPIRNVKMVGSRFSGKTHGALHFILKAFLAFNGELVAYVVRKKERQLSKMKEQIFIDLDQEYNFKVEAGKNFRGPPHNELKFRRNRIFFETLNDEKVDPNEGGVVGGATFSKADYIIVFFEECNQLNRKMVDQFMDTVRGGKQTKYLFIFASNPWKTMHWYTKMINSNLPENEYEMKTKGFQYAFVKDEDKSVSLFIRNNVLTNRHVPIGQIYKLQSYKHYSLNSFRICFLGLCGMSENTLYGHSYEKSKQVDYDFINNSTLGRLHVGFDWGEGKSRLASPSTLHIARVSPDFGCHVFDEFTHWNNGDGDRIESQSLSTVEQFDKVIAWLMKQWNRFQEPLLVFVDTGALIDFHQQLNDRLTQVWGVSMRQIQFLPADKSIPIQERVLTTNILLAKGLLRVDKEKCPNLHLALVECTQVESTNPKEEQKFERDHDYSHWLNSGVEYILDSYQYSLSKGFSEIYETRQQEEF